MSQPLVRKSRGDLFNEKHFVIRPLVAYRKTLSADDFHNVDVKQKRREFLSGRRQKVRNLFVTGRDEALVSEIIPANRR